MKITPIKSRIFKENENLIHFIQGAVKKIPESAVLVITSKIVALSEGRTSSGANTATKKNLVRKESDFALETKYVLLTIKDGMVMANAGIDDSNANGKLILLPKDSFRSAALIRKKLQKIYNVKKLGVLITDSRLFPLRAGVVGVALGYAGFKGIKSYKGTPDIFGRKFVFSQTDIADSLATSAVLCMGEGKEQQPLALITDAPIVFTERVNKKELLIDPKEDIYAPLFAELLKKK